MGKMENFKRMCWRAAGWVGGVSLAFVGLAVVLQAPTATLILLVMAALVIPYTRDRFARRFFTLPTGTPLAVILIAGLFGAILANTLHSEHAEARRQAEAQAAAQQAEAARQDSLRTYFDAHGPEIVGEAQTALRAGKEDSAAVVLKPFVFLQDSSVTALMKRVAAAKDERKKAAAEEKLLADARATPAGSSARLQAIYERLAVLRPENATYRQRSQMYQRRATAEAAEAKRIAAVAARRAYAKTLENKLMDQWMDVKVEALGARATTLRLTYVLFDRVWAHQFSQNADVMDAIRSMGFKRLEIRDGYDFGVYWTFN